MNPDMYLYDSTVLATLETHGISRVVHFTPAVNLHHIVEDEGIRPNSELSENAQEYFQPTDILRQDSHPEMTCVTFMYPNPFYFDLAKNKPHLSHVEDWVCLLIDPSILARDGSLFAPCNAAKNSGNVLMAGTEGLDRCFASNPPFSNQTREPSHHASCPTDLQAEALVPGKIPLTAIHSVVTPSEPSTKDGRARLNSAGLDFEQFQWVVSPMMFQKWPLVTAIQQGKTIEEQTLFQRKWE